MSSSFTYSSSTYGITPLPINCTCEVGYMSSRCEERVCNSRTCVHGTCTPSNASIMVGPDRCICNNPLLWTGSQCNIPICSPGCDPIHGSCTNQPGTCICAENWDGPQCTIEIGWLAQVGKYVTHNAEPIYITCTSLGMLLSLLIIIYINYNTNRKGNNQLNSKTYANYGSSGPTTLLNNKGTNNNMVTLPGLSTSSSSGTSSEDDYSKKFNTLSNTSSLFNDSFRDSSAIQPLTMNRSRHGAALAFTPTAMYPHNQTTTLLDNNNNANNTNKLLENNNNALLATRNNPTNNPTSIISAHHTTLSTKHSHVSQRLFNVAPPGLTVIGKEKKRVRFGGAEISEFIPQSIPILSGSITNTNNNSISSPVSPRSPSSSNSNKGTNMDTLRFQQAFSDSEGDN